MEARTRFDRLTIADLDPERSKSTSNAVRG